MPELPEVETTVRGLKRTIVGHTIHDVRVIGNSFRLLRSHAHHSFLKEVVGTRIEDARRRAKNVILDLDNQHSILIHMRMSGHLLVTSDKRHVTSGGRWEDAKKDDPFADPKNQFIRIVFELSDGVLLALCDLRKFATLDLFETKSLSQYFANKYGPEPFDQEFSKNWFFTALQKKKRAIKTLLLDQTFIAGVGNIYADESLWLAKIHPLTLSNQLTRAQADTLSGAVQAVLKKGISLGGTSDDDYRTVTGTKGKYGLVRNAYRMQGTACKRCGTRLERLVVGQRGTSFCPHCQKHIEE